MMGRGALPTGLVVFFASIVAGTAAERLPQRIPILGDFVGLQLAHNAGIAFSIDVLPAPLLMALILTVLGCLLAVASGRHKTPVESLALSLIIAGASANVIDRLMDGRVTDFIQIGTFPVFNLADSAVTVGAALLLSEAFWGRPQRPVRARRET